MTDSTNIYDVVVIGAGLAGLTCAKQLQQQNYKVLVLDKSRGVGGRVATRRVNKIPVDHGLPVIEIQGEHTEKLIKQLCNNNILQLWEGKVYELDSQHNLQPTFPTDRYIASEGINAIAKYLATDLDIKKQYRVTAIQPTNKQIWQITDESNNYINAKAVVIAIPAPQALTIIKAIATSLPSDFLTSLRAVKFHPCIAVMAGYSTEYLSKLPPWQAVKVNIDADLSWIALDSSKRKIVKQAVFVIHSTPEFATQYLNTDDLQPAGQQLLKTAASLLLPWLDSPEWMQVHRWRYSIPSQPLSVSYLATDQPLSLVCCGDWCNGNGVESALLSGFASADKILEISSNSRSHYW